MLQIIVGLGCLATLIAAYKGLIVNEISVSSEKSLTGTPATIIGLIMLLVSIAFGLVTVGLSLKWFDKFTGW